MVQCKRKRELSVYRITECPALQSVITDESPANEYLDRAIFVAVSDEPQKNIAPGTYMTCTKGFHVDAVITVARRRCCVHRVIVILRKRWIVPIA